MYDPSAEPYPDSPPIRFTSGTGHHVHDLTITDPPQDGFNSECVHLHNGGDVLIENIKGLNWAKNLVRLQLIDGALIRNCHGNSQLNASQSFSQGIVLGAGDIAKATKNVSIVDTFISNLKYGGTREYLNGDCVTVSAGCENTLIENFQGRNTPDSIFDFKSSVIVRNAVCRDAGHYSVRAWPGTIITLINVTVDMPIQVLETAQVRCFNVTFNGAAAQTPYVFVRGATFEANVSELASDPYPDGLPHYVPGGVVIPPVSSPFTPEEEARIREIAAEVHSGV